MLGTHTYKGAATSRHARNVSKTGLKAISGARLEELLGKSTKVMDPGPPVFRRSVGKK